MTSLRELRMRGGRPDTFARVDLLSRSAHDGVDFALVNFEVDAFRISLPNNRCMQIANL